MNLKIDQIAVACSREIDRQEALSVGGFTVFDRVTAVGYVGYGSTRAYTKNIADLAFNYTMIPGVEYEVLRYVSGLNWIVARSRSQNVQASHFGIHVSSHEEMEHYRSQYKGDVLQEVVTIAHDNPACAERRYHYLILDAYHQFGCALKVIRRLTLDEGAALRNKLEGVPAR